MLSLSIPLGQMFDYASQMFNALWPIAALGAGLSLGVGIIGLLVRLVSGALKQIGG